MFKTNRRNILKNVLIILFSENVNTYTRVNHSGHLFSAFPTAILVV